MAFLSLRGVAKAYASDGQSVFALQDLSLEIERGQFVVLLGRSGCGKSTLLNLAGAMDFPSAGEVLLDGTSTSALNDGALTMVRREKVGFIFQSFQLLHTLSAIENVELPLQLAGSNNAREIAQQRLAWVEMDALGHRLPHQLSGGQMQRVAIARALVHSPGLLLADEPTGNLDNVSGGLVLDLLQNLTRQCNTATVMATHSREASALADVVVELSDGKIQSVTRR